MNLLICRYLDMVLQFGYVVMFSACMPLAPALNFTYNMWNFRGETIALTYVKRRLAGEGTSGIGIWCVCWVLRRRRTHAPRLSVCVRMSRPLSL